MFDTIVQMIHASVLHYIHIAVDPVQLGSASGEGLASGSAFASRATSLTVRTKDEGAYASTSKSAVGRGAAKTPATRVKSTMEKKRIV
jgi:hypothetical protein